MLLYLLATFDYNNLFQNGWVNVEQFHALVVLNDGCRCGLFNCKLLNFLPLENLDGHVSGLFTKLLVANPTGSNTGGSTQGSGSSEPGSGSDSGSGSTGSETGSGGSGSDADIE